MDELLQKLLEAEVLSEDTKNELEEAFKSQLNEAIDAAKEAAAADVRIELTEEWVKEKEVLVEAIDAKVGEYLESEIEELKEDIERFRDLEAEHAEKLVEEKAAMRDELKSDLSDLVEKIDSFLEIRLAAEIEELHEDIAAVRQNEFGRKIFEAFSHEFMDSYADDESAEVSLRETEKRLSDTESALEEAERKLSGMIRSDKLNKVLSPLQGRQREVMEAILKHVETPQLEEGYKTFIGRVLREASEEDVKISEKEEKVLAESDEQKTTVEPKGKAVTGDTEIIEESTTTKSPEEDVRLAHLRKLAGIV